MRLFVSAILLLAANLGHAITISTVPDWDGNQAGSPFGETNTATYGQTFRLYSADVIESFTFYLNDRAGEDTIDFEAYIYRWDDVNNRTIGDSLFTSAPMTTTQAPGYEEFTVNTGGVSVSAGKYVAFFSASNLFDGERGTSQMGLVAQSLSNYNDGDWVYMNNGDDFGRLSTHSWAEITTYDTAFTVQTSSVPVPAAVWLFGSAIAGLGWFRRASINA